MAFKQDDRLIRLKKTPLGDDAVFVTSFTADESISRLSRGQIEFLSTDLDIAPEKLIAKPARIEVDRFDSEGKVKGTRYFNGFISRFAAGDVTQHETGKFKYRSYRAELVPWLWFLSQAARCYIFFPEKEEKTIYEIVEDVLKRAKDELGIQNVTFDLSGINSLKNRKVKHCVQYRETDFNFLSRILEQYGAFYYFQHTKEEHKLFLVSELKYPKCEEAEVPFPKDTTGNQSIEDHVDSWEHSYEFVSGKWEHTDYNFRTPSTTLKTNSSKIKNPVGESDKLELYDFPGEFEDPGTSSQEARIRMEEEETPHNVVTGTSTCRSFAAAHTFKLKGHPSQDVVSEHKNSYLITTVRHAAAQPPPETGGSTPANYTNSFTCIPSDCQFRPARITPKPAVSGIQTAVVVGPKGEEIHTDKYGRVKVHFHWDREELRKRVPDGEKFFCWVRVSHQIAGKQWGFMAIPRIGQEVVIDFLEGDPDRPLIVGSVYNEEQMPHYTLPDEKTKTYIKTNSTLGGEGFNELCFEDKKDDERVFVHAEKNMDTRVKNDSKSRIYGNRHQIIGWTKDGKKGGDQKEMVWQDKHIDIKRNQEEHVEGNMKLMIGNGEADDGGNLDVVTENDHKELTGGNHHLHVQKNQYRLVDGSDNVKADGNASQEIGGHHNQSIGGDSKNKVGADLHLTVTNDRMEKVGSNQSLTVGMNQQEKVGMKHAVDAGMEIHLKAGMKVVIEAGVQLSLKGAGGFIDINPGGVFISGMMVMINSGGAAGAGGGSSPKAPKIPESPESPEDAAEAKPVEPEQAHNSTTGYKSAPG